eukprot:TRINITY_DN61303_c0_g1_i1.p1 TRINITY_DN61303_c0_g1~~TRINITY_DN61303_c0_g1_i1.p1  ORF type:complete len:234 (+),score=13.68 TRINITY_DN61303_c0_g1_i1:98-799(+)
MSCNSLSGLPPTTDKFNPRETNLKRVKLVCHNGVHMVDNTVPHAFLNGVWRSIPNVTDLYMNFFGCDLSSDFVCGLSAALVRSKFLEKLVVQLDFNSRITDSELFTLVGGLTTTQAPLREVSLQLIGTRVRKHGVQSLHQLMTLPMLERLELRVDIQGGEVADNPTALWSRALSNSPPSLCEVVLVLPGESGVQKSVQQLQVDTEAVWSWKRGKHPRDVLGVEALIGSRSVTG